MINNYIKNKKILITGGAGLLGTSLTKIFSSLGAEVISTYYKRQPPKKYERMYKKYDFSNFDNCLKATNDIDYVVLAAVQASGVKGVLENPTSSILPNLKIHAGLFEACAQNKVKKVVWISSSSVYQKCNYPISEDELNLNLPTYDLYLGIGWVYRYLEKLAECYYLKRGLQVGIIRTANIYGPYDRFDETKSHVIPSLIRKAVNKEKPFIVWGNKETVRDFVFSDDLSYALLQVLEKYCNGKPINFSSGIGTNIGELVKLILDVCDHSIKPTFDSSKPTALPYRVLNNKIFMNKFKTLNRTSLLNGLKKTLDWYQSDNYRE